MNTRDKLLGDDAYGFLIRVAGVALAFLLWYVSMRFSVSGFQIASQENAWVGWVLGATVTYLQLVFNRGTRNKTMYVAGILAYIYGITTNLVGIMALRQTSFTMEFLQATPLAYFLQLAIVVGLALIVEVLPEHLFILGIRDSDDSDDSDFINSLTGARDVFNGQNRNPRQRRQQQKKQQQQSNQHNQQKRNHQQQGHGGQQKQSQQHPQRPPYEGRQSEIYYPANRE